MPSFGTPPAEYPIDTALVAALLQAQHPDLAHLPLQHVDAGFDNAMFRLGAQWAVRLPRRSFAAPFIAHEQAWLPRLAEQVSLPIPVPIRTGTPALGYPWAWSIVPWLKGTAADQHEPHASQAPVLAAFLRSLHVAAPADAPVNPMRGIPLRQREEGIASRMERLAAKTESITQRIRQIWAAALEAPIDVAPTWLHGDLHSRNVLVENGSITGIVDWGDLTAGDRATDLASIWMLFAEPHARRAALASYGEVSDATLRRAQGWAVLFGVLLLDSGREDNPRHALMGERALCRVAEPL